MTDNPVYSSQALDIVLAEATRNRAMQSQRIATLQSRAGVLIGGSGLAAGLVSSVATNPFWLIPVSVFFLAALLGILAIAPRAGYSVFPGPVFEAAEGRQSIEVKVSVITGIISEFDLQESKLRWPAVAAKTGTACFVLAVALVGVVAFTALDDQESTAVIDVRLVEE